MKVLYSYADYAALQTQVFFVHVNINIKCVLQFYAQ